MKQSFVVNALLLSLIHSPVTAVGLTSLLGIKTQPSKETPANLSNSQTAQTSTTNQPNNLSEPTIPCEVQIAVIDSPQPASSPTKQEQTQIAAASTPTQKMYSTILWDPKNSWHSVSEPVIPQQVHYLRKVNYETIAAEIAKTKAIPGDQTTTMQHSVENAIRDKSGEIDAILKDQSASIEAKAKSLHPAIVSLTTLAINAAKLDIINTANKQLAIALAKKHQEILKQLKNKQKDQIQQYQNDMDNQIVKLGFSNDIERAVNSITYLDPHVVDSHRAELEGKINSILETLMKEITQTDDLDKTSDYIQDINTIVTKSESLKLSISQHQMTALQKVIQSNDQQIDQQISETVKQALKLRKKNKNARKKISEILSHTYVQSSEESLSDNEYDTDQDVLTMVQKGATQFKK